MCEVQQHYDQGTCPALIEERKKKIKEEYSRNTLYIIEIMISSNLIPIRGANLTHHNFKRLNPIKINELIRIENFFKRENFQIIFGRKIIRNQFEMQFANLREYDNLIKSL